MLDTFIIQDIVRCLYTIEFVKVISDWSLTYIYIVQNRWHTVEHGFDLPCKPIDTKKNNKAVGWVGSSGSSLCKCFSSNNGQQRLGIDYFCRISLYCYCTRWWAMASLLLLVDATLNLGDTLLPVAEIADCTAAILFFFFFLNFFIILFLGSGWETTVVRLEAILP